MMETMEALKIVAQHRKKQVVIAAMTALNGWEKLSSNELDMPFSGAMGKASSLGLGLALARPDVTVWVIDGDGSLLNNLGTLVTIGNMSPANLYHFVLHNGVYQVSGGQPIPGDARLSFCGLAKAAGYSSTFEFDDLEDLYIRLPEVLRSTGPILICLNVKPSRERLGNPGIKGLAQSMRRVKAILERS